MTDEDDQKKHLEKEIEQERNIFFEIKKELSNKIEKLETDNKKLQENIKSDELSSKEAEQEKILMEGFAKDASVKRNIAVKKYYITIVIAAVVLSGILVPYSLYVTSIIGEEYRIISTSEITTGYVIQNLKGDIITTWLSWHLTYGDILHVYIMDADKYPEKTEIIKNAILSTEILEIDDSLTGKGPKGSTSSYYLGWIGALEQSSQSETTFYIPKNIEIVDSDTGDITINLVDFKDGDGIAGFTKSIVDDAKNQILKSEITIFDIDNLSDEKLATVVRHEFGHALGLAHSTAPEDLMAKAITTEFPYISECDVDAIISLYDKGKLSVVVCKK